jgi:hypothetical protein
MPLAMKNIINPIPTGQASTARPNNTDVMTPPSGEPATARSRNFRRYYYTA